MDRRRRGYLTCPLAVFNDEGPRADYRMFNRIDNLSSWEGPRVRDGRPAGGGRWVVRGGMARQDYDDGNPAYEDAVKAWEDG